MLNLEKLILETSKEFKNDMGNTDLKIKLETIKSIKTEKQAILTKRGAPKEWTEELEVGMLRKMLKERRDNVVLYGQNNRTDLADKEEAEAKVIEAFLPAEISDAQILDKIFEWKAKNNTPNMGVCIKFVKSAYPTAEGSKVAKLVKDNI